MLILAEMNNEAIMEEEGELKSSSSFMLQP
jgi:hypothetical protein